ncbi:MAG TPA: cation acetate symporter [Acidimicrobiia bacterium]|nr:cation acetate symporter [Acidimicrobiia bacterium]
MNFHYSPGSNVTLAAVVVSTIATILIGAYGMRVARTTSDFFVASRTVRPMWNASAISGEYLSAASFLGVAGLVMKYGVDMLWYPVGFAAGYLVLLLLVAAPLRRFGAYTIPDFAEGRLDSLALRRLATTFVLLIGWFYLLPQLKGAGVTLRTILGAPYWVGVVGVGALITANVFLGGMKGITFVQAFQYWLKVTAISLPAIVLLLHYQADNSPRLTVPVPPQFRTETVVRVRVDARFEVDAAIPVRVVGTLDGARYGPDRPSVTLPAGRHHAAAGAEITFPAGVTAPHAVGQPNADGRSWSRPFGAVSNERSHPLFFTYSLMLATFLGTMGLPHILVRFYTNPDGRAARQTTLIVLVLLGGFYVFPAVYGALGRLYAPDLYLTKATDTVVLALPGRVFPGLPGELLSGLVAAGAFAAFLSTASGLLISVAGALAQDVFRGSVTDFRRGAAVAGTVAVGFGLLVEPFDINLLVGWAFAIAASSFCPLLVLGIWWRGLTAAGAGAGIAVGGGLASAAILITMIGHPGPGWTEALLGQPAAWSVPAAFLTMVVVSRLTARRMPAEVGAKMVAMHTPEALGLGRNYRD